MAGKAVFVRFAAAIMGSGVLCMAAPGMASATGTSTFCSAAGLPSTSKGVVVPHVINATVNTCANEKTPTNPPCSFAVDRPGLVHLRVYACAPLALGPTNSPNSSPANLLASGSTTPPPDCGVTVDRVIAGWEFFACASTPAAP